jgi:hypothetical protein
MLSPDLYSALPEVFKLAEHTWGIALLDLRSILFLFIALTGIMIACAPWRGLSVMLARPFRWGITVSGSIVAGAGLLLWLSVNRYESVYLLSEALLIGGFGVLCFALLIFTHRTFVDAC